MSSPELELFPSGTLSLVATGGGPDELVAAVRDRLTLHFQGAATAPRSASGRDGASVAVHVDSAGVAESVQARVDLRRRLVAIRQELDASIRRLSVFFDTTPDVGHSCPPGGVRDDEVMRRVLRRAGLGVAVALVRDFGGASQERMNAAVAITALTGNPLDSALDSLPRRIAVAFEILEYQATDIPEDDEEESKARDPADVLGPLAPLARAVRQWSSEHAAATDMRARLAAMTRLWSTLDPSPSSGADEERRQQEDLRLAGFTHPSFDTRVVDRAHFMRIAHRLGLRLHRVVTQTLRTDGVVARDQDLFTLTNFSNPQVLLSNLGGAFRKAARSLTGTDAGSAARRELLQRAAFVIEPLALASVSLQFNERDPDTEDDIPGVKSPLSGAPSSKVLARGLIADALVEFATVIGQAQELDRFDFTPRTLPFWPDEAVRSVQRANVEGGRAELAALAVRLTSLRREPPAPTSLLATLDELSDRRMALAQIPELEDEAWWTLGGEQLAFAERLGALAGVDEAAIRQGTLDASLSLIDGFAGALEGRLAGQDFGGDDGNVVDSHSGGSRPSSSRRWVLIASVLVVLGGLVAWVLS